jgi:GNAT superfamily N-acetyltransferase
MSSDLQARSDQPAAGRDFPAPLTEPPYHQRCELCDVVVSADDLSAFGDAMLGHIRTAHPEAPWPDDAIRDYAEATQRLSRRTDRMAALGEVTVHPVTEDRIDDWLRFFDRDAFADNPAWAACYCAEPHLEPRGGGPEPAERRTARSNRAAMIDLLRGGRSFGYLAYVDGEPAGWVNASKRSEYALYRLDGDGDAGEPPDDDVIGVSCFVIAPPYRRHGLATQLLARVLDDLPSREATWVEAYPGTGERPDDASNFRGPRPMYESCGFLPVEERERYVVVRRLV